MPAKEERREDAEEEKREKRKQNAEIEKEHDERWCTCTHMERERESSQFERVSGLKIAARGSRVI